MSTALAIGLSDGDCTPLSAAGTVLLRVPWSVIEGRIAQVKTARDRGLSLAQAVNALPELG